MTTTKKTGTGLASLRQAMRVATGVRHLAEKTGAVMMMPTRTQAEIAAQVAAMEAIDRAVAMLNVRAARMTADQGG